MKTRNMGPAVGLAILAGMTAGCLGEHSIAGPVEKPEDLFWKVELNHRAVTINSGGQLQLQATPITPFGEPIASLASQITYRSTDTMRVKVNAQGRVTAHDVGNNIQVIATLRSEEQNLTNADTAWINVVATGPAITSFSIQPDSTKLAVGSALTLAPKVFAGATAISNVRVSYTSVNPQVLSVNPTSGALTARDTGSVKIAATATIFGQTFRDTVNMRLTYPYLATFAISNLTYQNTDTPLIYLSGVSETTIRVGGEIRFNSRTPTPLTVTFSDPTATDLGNIPPFEFSQIIGRKFIRTGTYTFTIPGLASGKITVVP